MRVTYHNGRGSKGGGSFSAKHNDRNFDIENADHIDPARQNENFYWHCFKKSDPQLTFEQVEKKFYEEHFKDFLNDRNEKYLQQRHKDKVQIMDDYLKSRKSCPEEIIFAIGNIKDFKNLDTKKIAKVYNDFRHWRKEKYPNVVSLNVALHADEEGVPHIQERVVWIAHDDRGREMVNQGQALREMGISLPNPEKKESRYNNAKITFTQDCRQKFFDICRGYGIEIEEEPKERSEVGLSLAEYKTRQEEQKLQEIKLEFEKTKIENVKLKDETEKLRAENTELKKNCRMMQIMKNDYKDWLDKASDDLEQKEGRLKIVNARLQKGKKVLGYIKNRIGDERKNLRFMRNLVKICDNNEKKLKILVDVVKENDKGAIVQPKYDANGYMEFDKDNKPIFEKIGGVFGDLTTQKLAGLVMPPPKERDLDDWNLLSEAEKADRLAHQSMDNYGL